MADASPRELLAATRHTALALIEMSLRGEPVVWRLAGLTEDELRQLATALVGLGAVFARGAAAGRGVSPQEVLRFVQDRIETRVAAPPPPSSPRGRGG